VVTAQDLIDAVRVHADRVHDAVRRLGCGPRAAVSVVEASALELVDSLAAHPEHVGDPVGAWFARALLLGRQTVGGEQDDLPVGRGLLSGDANQVRLAEALEGRPEMERAALLLRDSYDLPASAVGSVLGMSVDAAEEAVGASRLAFLPSLVEGSAPSLAQGHPVDLEALSRLAAGGPAATRDATTRRHVQSCDRCSSIVDAQERARRLLSGLTVVSLPDGDRERLLARVEVRARAVLPAAVALVPAAAEAGAEDDDGPRRLLPVPLIALGLLLATAAGAGLGFYESRGPSTSRAAVIVPVVPGPTVTATTPPAVPKAPALPTPAPTGRVPVDVITITPSPAPSPSPSATPTPTPSASPTPSATPSASATPTPSATPAPTEPLALALAPASGPNGTAVQVSGCGWQPGAAVTLHYLDRLGADTGSAARAVVDAKGRFTTTITADDPKKVPGRHTIRAGDGKHTDSAAFNASG